MCIDTYNYLYQKALDDNISNKRLKHINNFAKKFHNSIVYADNVSYGPNTLAHRGKPKGYRIPTKRHSFRQQQQNFRLQQEIIHSKQTQQELPF